MRSIAVAPIAVALTCLLLSPQGATADPKGESVRDIRRLAHSVRTSVRSANVPARDLEKARWHLSRALAILEGRDPGFVAASDGPYDYDACVDFAYDAYARSHDPKTARQLATDKCKGFRLLGVSRLLYRAYSQSYAPPTAMDLALERATNRRLRGKTELLSYAIDRYSKSYAPSTAVERAIEEVAQMRAAGAGCVKRANRSHAGKDPAFTALDKAFAECRDRFGEHQALND